MTLDGVAHALAATGASLRAAGVVAVTYRVLPRDRLWIGVEPLAGDDDEDDDRTAVAIAAVTLALWNLEPDPPLTLDIGHVDERGSMVIAWPPRTMMQGVRRQLDRLEDEMRHLQDLDNVDRLSTIPPGKA